MDRQEHVATTRQLHRAGGATHDHVDGANLGVRADAYWRVGGFRPLRVGADVDLVERLAAARTPIVRDTRDPVLTSARVS